MAVIYNESIEYQEISGKMMIDENKFTIEFLYRKGGVFGGKK